MSQRKTIKWVPINILRFDQRVNRPVDDARVKRYARDFDPEAFGVIEVSLRTDGTLIVIDGQHRIEAMLELDWGDQKVPCRIHEDLTLKDEAALFIKLNDYKVMSHLQKFMKRIVAGEHVACKLAALVREQGWRINHVVADGHVTATASLEKVYRGSNIVARKDNAGAVHDTLETLRRTWGSGKDVMQGQMIQGMGLCFLRENGNIDKARMVSKLSKYPGGPNGVVGAARSLKQMVGMTLSRAIAQVIVSTYNKGARKNKLASWET